MKSACLLSLLAVAALATTPAPVPAPEPGGPVELLDAPGGRPIAILLSGPRPRVLEQREGYVKVALEGWVRAPGAADAAMPAPEPAPPGGVESAAVPAAAAGSLTGAILVTLPSGEVRKGAGARVVLLGKIDELEAARGELVATYQPAAQKLQEEIAGLEAKRRAALNSTDNLGQATQSLDRAKRDLAARKKDLASLQATTASREGLLVSRHAVEETKAGADGSFRFAGLAPGEYRLWAIYSENDATDYRWYLPARVEAGSGAALELVSRKPGEDPFLTIP
jgi:hypothetical protein